MKIVNFTEAQAGGRSKYSTVDQLYVLKSLIQQAVANKTKLYIAYIDLEKAYDRAWKQIIFHTMWKAGVKGKIWRMVRKLNEGLKTVVKTRHGITRKVKIPESIRQGGVLSVLEFAKMMDRLSEMLQKENLGVWYGRIQISSLLFMDDAVIIENNHDKFKVALETVERFRKLYKLVLNQGKSKTMVINADERDKNTIWKSGKIQLEPTDKYTYLGEILTTDGNIDHQIKVKQQKVKGITSQIKALTKEQVTSKMSLKPQIDMYKVIVIPTLLYGCETWTLSKKQLEQLEQTQNEIIRQILKTAKGTPKPALLLETGIIPIKYQIYIKQMAYLHKVISMKDDRIQKTILYYQLLQPELNQKFMSIGQQWVNGMKEYNLHYTVTEVGNLTKTEWCKIVERQVMEKAKTELLSRARELTKLQKMLQSDQEIKLKLYCMKLPAKQAQIIFKARTKMLPMKSNYGTSKFVNVKELVCQWCKKEKESQEHLIDKCEGVERKGFENIQYQQIFTGTVAEKYHLANWLIRVLDINI